MALNSTNVDSALTGAVYKAPLGTTAPVTPTAAWAAGWLDLGYIDEKGLIEAEKRDWNEIKAWQNHTVVRRLLKGAETTFKFTTIENTRYAAELRHAGSLVTTATGVHTLNVATPTEDLQAFGFDIIDLAKHHRIIIPRGGVTEVQDITYANGEAIGYGFTISAFPSSTGLVAIKLSDAAAWAAAA